MGIRFRCHHCEHELNLKEFQAGRRARCPACSGRFRVPTASAEFSDPLDDQEVQLAATMTAVKRAAASGNTFNLRPSSSDPDVRASQAAATGAMEHAAPAVQSSMPAAIQEAPQAVWYVRPPGGQQYGPAEGHLFNGWLQDNRIGADSLVWRDGWPQWQLAGDVFVEHFGANWRVAVDGSSEVAVVNDDSIGSAIESDAAAPGEPQPVISKVTHTRRKKKQTTYGIVIGILAILAIVLIGVLVAVVFK